MRKTLIVLIAATPLVALGATAFAAQSTSTADDLFIKANSTPVAAEKAEPLKNVDIKKLRLGDDDGMEHGLSGEQGEAGEGMDD